MFTGIIQDVGRVVHAAEDGTFRLATNLPAVQLGLGTSICCNGACMTVTHLEEGIFTIHVSPESRAVTTLKDWCLDTWVNLEPSLRVGDELAGHYVTGHVDGVGELVRKEEAGDGNWCIAVRAPKEIQKFIAQKGSITVDGIALTVNQVKNDVFEMNIIPHTWQHTALQYAQVGDVVNLEIDPIARYVARLIQKSHCEE